MFKLLEMVFASRRMALAEEAAKPWVCPECGTTATAADARMHLITHKVRIISEKPLIVELRCWDWSKDLGPALNELRRRWPGRRFQLVSGSFATSNWDGNRVRTIVAIEDDWTIPHDPFGP